MGETERSRHVRQAEDMPMLDLFDQITCGSFMPGVDDYIFRGRLKKLLEENKEK